MKLAFVGDVMLGRLVNELLKWAPSNYPWGDTLSILRSADMRICNLECALTDYGQPWSQTPKIFHFRSDEKNVTTLVNPPINMVALANNHVLDYGYEGLARTTKVLTDAQIVFAGAGASYLDASTVGEYVANGVTVGMIAVTDNEPSWEATEMSPGVFYVPVDIADTRAKRLFELITLTRDDVDILIISTHWGPNWGYNPLPEHVNFAHALIDAGVDIVYGHSPHIFRGIELYKDKPILYSTGDFIDDYAVDELERNDESFIFMLDLMPNPTRLNSITLFPTLIADFQAQLAPSSRVDGIVTKMQELCLSLGTKSVWQPEQGVLQVG